MKKSLFDLNDRYRPEAIALSTEVNELLRPKVKELADQGYSLRDINCVLVESVQEIILEELLIRPAMKKEPL